METDNLFIAYANLFFENPAIEYPPPRNYSILYLLRRDISICMGVDPSTGSCIKFQALFPAAMTVFAGIDLLGKFLAGSADRRQVGQRFCNFIDRYFTDISSEDANIIYQLRNALLHSFGLFSFSERDEKIYRFRLGSVGSPLIQHLESDDCYLIDLQTLVDKFEDAVTNYETDVRVDVRLQSYFCDVFPNYGTLYYRG